VLVISNPYVLLLSMTGVGIAWASILSMPYALLAGSLPPEKTGVYMGIFNFFIVAPEIIASLAFGWAMNHLLGNNRLTAVVCGGIFLVLAAVLAQRVDETDETRFRTIGTARSSAGSPRGIHQPSSEQDDAAAGIADQEHERVIGAEDDPLRARHNG